MKRSHQSKLVLVDEAQTEFSSILAKVPSASWGDATPCTEWNIGQLVDHVAGAALIYTALLQGQLFEKAMAAGQPSPTSSEGRRRYYMDAAASLRNSLARPGAMEQKCEVPGGPITGSALATVRIFDVTVHCWDLARAIGASERLPESILNHSLQYANSHYGGDTSAGKVTAVARTDMPKTMVTLLQITGRSP